MTETEKFPTWIDKQRQLEVFKKELTRIAAKHDIKLLAYVLAYDGMADGSYRGRVIKHMGEIYTCVAPREEATHA